MAEVVPIIGNWYNAKQLNDAFEVVAIDELNKCVEIQYFNGEIEEIDNEEWQYLNLYEVAQPEDWTGALEMNFEDEQDYIEDIRLPSAAERIVTIDDIEAMYA